MKPNIVCVSLSGFGVTGRRCAQPGCDYMLEGLTGWMSLTDKAHRSLVSFQALTGGDERWFVVAWAKEKLWRNLTYTSGAPHLAEDERFSDFAARHRNRTVLVALLNAIFAGADADHRVTTLSAAGAPVSGVPTVAEALANPHTATRDLVVSAEHERHKAVSTVRTAARVGDHAGPSTRAAARNEPGVAILEQLGYSPDRVTRLAQQGAFG